MTDKELLGLLRDKLDSDKNIGDIIERAAQKKADFSDTADYSMRLSEKLGEVLSGNVLDLDDRAAGCMALLRESYSEQNKLLAAVQRAIDEEDELNLAPQEAPFPTERAERLADSLNDEDADDETIQRRAASAATVSRSFHDDYMKENAGFRSGAGLQCYIERKSHGHCCAWCSKLLGKYRYEDVSDDIYRRHDHCCCTITFENGRTRQDVWSKHSQDVVEDPQALEEKALEASQIRDHRNMTSEEFSRWEWREALKEARALEAKNLQYKGLDNGGESGIIKNIELDDINKAVKGGTIRKEVVTEIYNALVENKGGFYFDSVKSVKNDPNIVMQTNAVKNGTFFDTVLNLNENYLGKKTLTEIDSEIKSSLNTVSNSLKDAVVHEIYHAKLINGLNYNELTSLYDTLSYKNISGISRTASKDGSECIAEIGVLLNRNETKNIPQEAKELFNKYMEEKI